MAKQQAGDVRVKGRIDLSGVELDPDAPLRVAVVRDDEILASQDLRAAKTASYDLAVPLESPRGFRVVVGRAGAPDEVFLASELASVPIAATAGRTAEATPIAVDAARYKLWLGWCRRFRVHGRVVCRNWRWTGFGLRFCDDPVPGATVEIYDVDRFWWFASRDLITTATTGPDGAFDVEFWWCCRPIYWWDRPWVIDPDVLERIKRLIDKVRPRIPFPIPDPPPDPVALQQWVSTVGAALEQPAFTAGPRAATAELRALTAAESRVATLLPDAELAALRVWPWWPTRDCAPDIVFRVTQDCAGETRVIRDESTAQTRWNVGQDVGVTLVASDEACCIPVCEDPPPGECVKFGEVGCTPVQFIGGNDPAVPVAPDQLGMANGDVSFARTMAINGVFGDSTDVDYYELEYSRDGAPFQPLPRETLGNLSRTFWGPPCGGGLTGWHGQAFPVVGKTDGGGTTHWVYETRAHFEQGCDPGSWGNPWFPGGGRFWTSGRDALMRWVTATTTSRAAGATPPDGSGEMTETLSHASMLDGLYRLRVIGWKEDAAGNLVDRRELERCNTDEVEELLIRLDNRSMPDHPAFAADHPWGPGFVHLGTRDPDCDFTSIVKNEGRPGQTTVAPCDIVELDADDTLTFHFLATVPPGATDRHLGGYWLQAHHGESATFSMIDAAHQPQPDPDPFPGPSYAAALAQGAPAPWWGGGRYKLTLTGADFPETCAYLFRLHAWKRVFDGCAPVQWFHANDTEVSITIQKS